MSVLYILSLFYIGDLFYPKQQRVVHKAVVIEKCQISFKCVHDQNDVFFWYSQTEHVVEYQLLIINIFQRASSELFQNILFGFDLHYLQKFFICIIILFLIGLLLRVMLIGALTPKTSCSTLHSKLLGYICFVHCLTHFSWIFGRIVSYAFLVDVVLV